jgi:8-amino-7-oxononanoate synthase
MTRSAEEIQTWIQNRVGTLLDIPGGEIDVRAPFTRHGLDSVMLITLATDLENWLGYRFHANPLDIYPTIEALSRFLADESARGGP